MYETTGEIRRLNSSRPQLEKEVEDRMEMIDIYDFMMMENGQQTNG